MIRPARRIAGRAPYWWLRPVLRLALGLVVLLALSRVPLWVSIVLCLSGLLALSVWATRPPERTMPRHVGALLGQAYLDVLAGALRALVGVVVVVLLAVAGWSFAADRIESAVGHWRDQAAASVVSSVPVPRMPSLSSLASLLHPSGGGR